MHGQRAKPVAKSATLKLAQEAACVRACKDAPSLPGSSAATSLLVLSQSSTAACSSPIDLVVAACAVSAPACTASTSLLSAFLASLQWCDTIYRVNR
jgi:hypothetical protein